MKIDQYNGNFDFFGFFLILSFIFISSFFAYISYKKYNLPIRISIAICSTTILFVILGAKIFTITSEQWLLLFTEGEIPKTNKLTVLGALAFTPIGIWIGKKLFKINLPILDLIAIPLPIALAIQRLGCFFAGCCYGTPSGNFFGICYAPYTSAHKHYYNENLLENFSDYTPLLHPVQLYLVSFSILGSLLIYFLRNKFTGKGSLFFLSLLSYFVSRFFIEFLRDPSTDGEFGTLLFGLKQIQWLLIIVSILCIGIIYFKEHKHSVKKNDYFIEQISFKQFVIGISLIFITVLATFNWLTNLERGCVFLFFSSTLFATIGHYLLDSVERKILLLKSIYLIIISFIILPLTAQIAFNNDKTTIPYEYHQISVGGSMIKSSPHYHEDAIAEPYQDCSGNTQYNFKYPEKKYTHNINWYGAGYKYNKIFGNYNGYHTGISIAGATDNDNDPNHVDQIGKNSILYDISGDIGFDTKLFALDVGGHFGTNRKANIKTGDQDRSLSYGKPIQIFYPKAAIRFGFVKYIYFEGRAGMHQWGLNGLAYPLELGIATGLGRNNGSYFRTSIDPKNENLCVGSSYVLNNGLGFELNFIESFKYTNCYSINFSASYRMIAKKNKKK